MKGSAAKGFILLFVLATLSGITVLILRSGQSSATPCQAPSVPPSTPQPIRAEKLVATHIVPTQEEPIPKEGNVLWCATFQLAWDRMKADLGGSPVVEGSESIADRLNRSPFPESDLPAGTFYARAGRGSETLDRIRSEMAKAFPQFLPDLPEKNADLVAYCYLKAGVPFTLPYFDSSKPLIFHEGSGTAAAVQAFGIRPEDDYAYASLRAQIEIVFENREHREWKVEEMVIDPCRTSTPNQLLLAVIPRKQTLKEAWDYVRSRLLPDGRGLGPNDTFLVPNVRCEIAEDFESLADHALTFPGSRPLKLDIARQAIEFRLNRGGAELGSESKVLMTPVPTHYHFDRPFLIVMRKRGSVNPFFLMWVETREVLK